MPSADKSKYTDLLGQMCILTPTAYKANVNYWDSFALKAESFDMSLARAMRGKPQHEAIREVMKHGGLALSDLPTDVQKRLAEAEKLAATSKSTTTTSSAGASGGGTSKPAASPAKSAPTAGSSSSAGSAPSPAATGAAPAPTSTSAMLDALIRERAREIWERKGKPQGRDRENWAEAEIEIRNELASALFGFAPPPPPQTAPPPRAPATAAAPPPRQPPINPNLPRRNFLFPSAEQLMNFVETLLTGHGMTSIPVVQLRRAMLVWSPPSASAKPEWGLSIPVDPTPPSPAMKSALDLFDAKEVTAFPAGGATMDLNECLERMRLCSTAAQPTRLECLIVVLMDGDMQALGKIYQSFPQGCCVQCRFFPGQFAAQGRQFTMLFFEQIRHVDRVSRWVRQLPPAARAFSPITGAAGDVFYCQWQHAHPVAALSRLYDATGMRYVLMGMPDSGARPWIKISRPLAEKSIHFLDQLFHIEVDDTQRENPPTIDAQGNVASISLPLAATRATGDGMVNTAALQRRAEALRRALADINAKYERVQQSQQGQCRVALAFFQDEDAPLSQRFKRFLQSPFFSLDSFTYFFIANGPNSRHILFSKNPSTLSEQLAACADEVYVQDARWRACELNVFLRQGVELSPRLDDPTMAEKCRQYLMPQGDADRVECCLIDAMPPDQPGDPYRLSIVAIRQTMPLPGAIRLLNEEFVEEFRRRIHEIPSHGQTTLEMRKIELSAALGEFYDTMAADLKNCTDAAEQRWQALHGRIATVQKTLDESEPWIAELERLLTEPCKAWEDFLDRLLELQERLTQTRRGLFAQLAQSVAEAQQKRQAVRDANIDAQTAIATAKTAVETEIAELQVIENQTKKQLDDLRNRFAELDSQITSLERRIEALAQQLRQHAAQMQNKAADLKGRMTQLRAQMAQQKKYRDIERQWLAAFDHRPKGLLKRRAAAQAFARLFLMAIGQAPIGFFKDEQPPQAPPHSGGAGPTVKPQGTP